ncbi:argininosuccinate synthase-related protein [Agrobacterium cavarae]|uniref:argininosuccinate synthase-related protein n=1 Tax=Agrobacterium cavarae TaxID=2528239 RepID=UPI0028AF6CC8|nr:argininosuccinate synthase-related protein [Agrobacterium cavarae]
MNIAISSIKLVPRRIESFSHIAAIVDRNQPVVTMFSGGLDSTFLLHRLHELGFKNIDAVAVDVGEHVDGTRLSEVAARFGARFVHIDGRSAFLEKGVKPAIRAHAKYLGNYPLSSSLSRPVIAEIVVGHARSIGSTLVLHTANLSQNSLPRLNNSIELLGFDGAFGSPYVQSASSRQQKAAVLADIGLTFMSGRKLSGDENLWCREFESGPLDDPEDFNIPEEAFLWTRKHDDAGVEEVSLTFEDGNLIAIDGHELPLIEAIAHLNTRIGKFGHGRYVGLEHLSTDDKVLEVREAPAAAIIMDALRHLEVASLSTGTMTLKQRLEQSWVQEAVSGRWGNTSHAMCERAISAALEGVGGTVTYIVDRNRFLPRSIIASNPRYVRDRDLWEYEEARQRSTFDSFATAI